MNASDKLDVVASLREQGVDMTKILLAPLVAQVEKYANSRRLASSNEPVDDAVQRFVQTDKQKFAALLWNGQQVPISQQAYLSESTYNFLPTRYKTMKLQ